MKHLTLKQIVAPAKKSLAKRIVKATLNNDAMSDEQIKSAENVFNGCCGSDLEKDLISLVVKYGCIIGDVYKAQAQYRKEQEQ